MITRSTITSILLLISIISTFGQVQNIKYGIKYIPGTSEYDCYFTVSSGFAESSEDRILSDAKFSIKVETGTSISLVSSSLPFLDNEFYNGAEPVMWSVSQSVISPVSDPNFDYYSFVPDLSQTSRFNDLFQNTDYSLFRISVEGSCIEGVQIFKNGIDPGSNGAGMGGKDFTNSLNVNSSSSLYSGLDEGTVFGAFINLNDVNSCDGDCVTVEVGGNCDLSNYSFLWDDGSTGASLIVCPDTTMTLSMLVEGVNGFSEQLSCVVSVEGPFIAMGTNETMCVDSELNIYVEGEREGTWISSDTNIAKIVTYSFEHFNLTYASGIKEGVFSVTFVDSETGCVSVSQDITIVADLEVNILEGTKLKVGESLSFGTSEINDSDKYWITSSPEIAVFRDGILYGVNPGVCEIYYLLDGVNCSSNSITIEVEENEVCNDDGIKIWEHVKIGDINESISIGASGSSTSFFSEEENNIVLVYDGITGEAFFNKLDVSGQLIEEIYAFSNENHVINSNYELELHDLDSNGLMDVIIIGYNDPNPHSMSIYRNIGNGSFKLEFFETWCSNDFKGLIEVIDFDNDGMLDIFTSCDDEYYRFYFNDNWSFDVVEGNDAPNYWVYPVDYNEDGFMDLVFQDEGIIKNNGNRTFTFDNTYDGRISNCWGKKSRPIYVKQSKLVIGYSRVYSGIDVQNGDYLFCEALNVEDHCGDLERLPKFYANINSTIDKEVVIVGANGFKSLTTSVTCNDIDYGFKYFNFGGVASKYNQIDIGNDGYTDFFYLEGNELYASINPNSNTSNTIKGTCYIDKNENGEFDADETPLRNMKIKTNQSELVILTDNNGKFKLLPPDADFDLQATATDGEWVQNTLSISSEDVKIGCLENNNFGFVQAQEVDPSASISISNSITRCDFETRFYITVENKGGEDSPLDLEFIFDEEATFMSTDIPGYSIENNTLSANLGMLSPFLPNTYKVTLKMPSGSSNLPMLNFGAAVSSDSQILDEYTYMEQLRCSYDPNDKRVYPDREGDENLTLFEEDLKYTIRFQNNGNDTAFVVRIVDPLDPNIDPSSISVISSSHPVETCIDQDTLVFLFEDIYLVDSMTNYALSQGFVTFSCRAKDGIDESTIINNTADIIFDSNDPIITNTTINTLVSEFCTDLEYDISAMICVGESLSGYTESGTYQDTYSDINGCDSIVNLELMVSSYMIHNNDLKVCEGDTILFNNLMITESTTLIDTLESSTGCIDSISVLAIQFVNKKENEIDVEICDGDNFDGLTVAGQYTFFLLSVQGCDSIVTVNLDVITAVSEDLSFSVCEGESLTIIDEVYQFEQSTEFIDTIFNANNCPVSYTNIQVTVIELMEISVDTMICEGEEFMNFTVSGNYVIDTTDQITGCPLTINLFLEVLSISDPNCIVNTSEEERIQIKLFPTPAKDRVVVKSEHIIESIEIFDMKFRKLLSMNTNATFAEISVRELNSGVYIMRCKMKDQFVYKKMIVQ